MSNFRTAFDGVVGMALPQSQELYLEGAVPPAVARGSMMNMPYSLDFEG